MNPLIVAISGKSAKPAYLLIQNGKLELRDASHLWGQDTIATETALRSETAENRLRVACIGPASERLSLICGISKHESLPVPTAPLPAAGSSTSIKASTHWVKPISLNTRPLAPSVRF